MLASCGSGGESPSSSAASETAPSSSVAELVGEISASQSDSISALDFETTGEVLEIVWGKYSPRPNQARKKPDDCAIAKELNERFNVVMTSSLRTGNDWTAEQQKQIDDGTLPDIFSPYIDYADIIEQGAAREIPWGMVERLAPNYASMLGETGGRITDSFYNYYGGDYFLFGLERMVEMLQTYSVYRLDWLEEIGVSPRGKLIEVEDRVFFTEEAFTSDEFADIMRLFTESGDGHRKGFSTGFVWATGIETIMGTYGLNLLNIGQDGSAVYSFASDGFREFLRFAEYLSGLEVVNVSDDPWNDRIYNKIGYWNDNLVNIFGEYGYSRNMLSSLDVTKKLLVTPPEIGRGGRQGVDFPQGQSFEINISQLYMISSAVSDEKLAKILEIFDAVSFDPELYVITRYGIEGEDFDWTGKPYESPVTVIRESTAYTSLFNTRTTDENAGKKIYDFPTEAMYVYATSAEARRMLIPPYKNDIHGEFENELTELHERFNYPNINRYGIQFYNEVVRGQKSADHDWDEYIAGYAAAGLGEFTELLNRFPVAGR